MTQLHGKNRFSFQGLTKIRAALALAAACTGLLSACMSAAPVAGSPEGDLVYVGMQAPEIRALRFDPASGKLSDIGTVATGLRSTWSIAHPRLPILYAVDDENGRDGSITAFAVDRHSGSLGKISQVASGGRGTTFLQFDAPSMTLFGANYASGSVSSAAVNTDGSLGRLVSTIKATGSGPNRRQASAHNHAVVIDPSGRYALVPDLGADRIFIYAFDRGSHVLHPDDSATPRSYVAPAGSGPRHLVFGKDGRYVYLINELSAEVVTLRWDAEQGRLSALQTLSISSAGFQGARSGAEVAISADGRFVYVEDRGENTMVVYRVDAASGLLGEVQRIASGGDKPWGFAIHASGKWLLVANQRSGSVNVFALDPVSGRLADVGQSVAVPVPVALTFVR